MLFLGMIQIMVMTVNMTCWIVVYKNTILDEVYYDSKCTKEYVRESLIMHDNFPWGISVHAKP